MKLRKFSMVPVLLVAAGLRLYGLGNVSPPGLTHDEVANWLIDRSILAGNHAVYFTEAYGHEAGFHYVQAAFVALLGDNALALRLPAAFAGIMLVAVSYAVARALFDRRVALIAAAFLAVLFWAVFFSRLGLRAISLPLVAGFSAYAWWQGMAFVGATGGTGRGDGRISSGRRIGPAAWLGLAGLLTGLSLYTYMAARALPIFYGLFALYQLLFDRHALSRNWRGMLLFWLNLALVSVPLAAYLLTNPAAEFRISEVDGPLQALRSGMLRPVLENSARLLGLLGWHGDPLWRQNVAGQPVFEPVTAVLAYAGLVLCLWRLRDRRYAFALLWIAVAVIPSILTVDAPSTIRSINVLLFLTVLPALVIHNLLRFSTVHPQLSTRSGIKSWITLLTLALLLFNLGRTSVWIFSTWPANPEVQFVWQQALTRAAAYLDEVPAVGPVAIGGWTPDTMDPPTMVLTLRREDLALRHFYPGDGLIVPAPGVGQAAARIIYPAILPPGPAIAEQLAAWTAGPELIGDFVVYTFEHDPQPEPQFPADVIFGQEIQLLGYDLGTECREAASMSCHLLTYWRVLQPAPSERRFFVHALGEQDEIMAQDDRNGAPAEHWRAGDLILQQHVLEWKAGADPGSGLRLRLGVYDPVSEERLPVENGADSLLLP